MPPALSTTAIPGAAKPRGTASWLLAASLLLGLLFLGHLARPTTASLQSAHRPVQPDSTWVLLTTWHQ